jgi:biopolymer transport protein TolR
MGFSVGSSGGGGKRRGNKVTPSMNVTPLVDVVLVLLIIFMVVTPLMVKQMSVRVPAKSEDQAQAEPDPNDVPIVVLVKDDGVIELNHEAIEAKALPDRLATLTGGRTDKIVFFSAEEKVAYGTAIAALDEAKKSGATLAVLTEKPQ